MHAVAPTAVSGMVVENGASSRIVARVPKEAQTSARHMAEVKDAPGGRANVRNLQGAVVGYVLLIAIWYKSDRRTWEGLSHPKSSMGL